MTPPSVVAVASALAVVLGIVIGLAWLVRRARGPLGGQGSLGRIEVLSRTGLGPRQGLATVRVEGRTALIGFGEGGVRHVMDLPAAQVDAEADADADADDGSARGGTEVMPFGAALARASRKVSGLRAMTLGLVLCAGLLGGALCGGPLAAQTTPPPSAAEADRAPDRNAAEAASTTPLSRIDELREAGQPRQMDLTIGGTQAEDALRLSGPVGTVIFIGFMTMIPTLLLLMTGFTRILIVLHLLKQALGTQTAPPAHLLAAMALLLTGFVMAPTFAQVNEQAIAPWMDGRMDELEMLKAGAIPMREFMLASTREQDLSAFVEMRGGPRPTTIDDVPLVVVTAAFVTSELTSAFQMGFAVFLPFMIIDVVVASVLMSMGMFMLPPVMVSLPFKLLLFVLVDGWSLVMGSLVRSFG